MSYINNTQKESDSAGDGCVQETLKEINQSLIALSNRISSLEETVNTSEATSGRQSEVPNQAQYGEYTERQAPTPAATAADVGAEFQRLKTSVQSVRLPNNLTLQESRQGIKKEDQTILNVLIKSARFAETAMKLLQNVDTESAPESVISTLDDLFTVHLAQIRYVQEEYTSLVVQGSFDPTVTRFFRSLQRNSSFTPEALENLRSAATIASAYQPQQQRGRGHRPVFRGGYHGRTDVFAQQAGRGFPRYHPRRENYTADFSTQGSRSTP